MIDLYVEVRSFAHELDELIRAFFPSKKVNILDDIEDPPMGDLKIEVVYRNKQDTTYISSKLIAREQVIDKANEDIDLSCIKSNKLLTMRYIKNGSKRCVYNMMSRFAGIELDWGILTGIRPTKIVNEMLDANMNRRLIIETLSNEYLLSPSKVQLLMETTAQQRSILSKNHNKIISLYINIPFCTTKCLYCSFPSDTIERCHDKLDKYIESLIYELKSVMDIILKKDYIIQTVYIGGGTPTSLYVDQLERLFMELDSILPHYIEEYTVEGGRPDSLDLEKLHLLRKYGVTRISINPQTMNADTLKRIGRSHTPDDIINCFESARSLGFDSINMDVIIGLPGETLEHVDKTMTNIYNLSPDNLTVHTLAIKKGSLLKEHIDKYEFADNNTAEEMLDKCKLWSKNMGMIPYYLYRQKYMLGNLENIGYSKPGKECIYNIQMMEERQTIWAFGAGGISKVFYEEENRLERVPNVKSHVEYMERIDEMIERKMKLIEK